MNILRFTYLKKYKTKVELKEIKIFNFPLQCLYVIFCKIIFLDASIEKRPDGFTHLYRFERKDCVFQNKNNVETQMKRV